MCLASYPGLPVTLLLGLDTTLEHALHCAHLCKHTNIHLTMLKCMNYVHIVGVARLLTPLAHVPRVNYMTYLNCFIRTRIEMLAKGHKSSNPVVL